MAEHPSTYQRRWREAHPELARERSRICTARSRLKKTAHLRGWIIEHPGRSGEATTIHHALTVVKALLKAGNHTVTIRKK